TRAVLCALPTCVAPCPYGGVWGAPLPELSRAGAANSGDPAGPTRCESSLGLGLEEASMARPNRAEARRLGVIRASSRASPDPRSSRDPKVASGRSGPVYAAMSRRVDGDTPADCAMAERARSSRNP